MDLFGVRLFTFPSRLIQLFCFLFTYMCDRRGKRDPHHQQEYEGEVSVRECGSVDTADTAIGLATEEATVDSDGCSSLDSTITVNKKKKSSEAAKPAHSDSEIRQKPKCKHKFKSRCRCNKASQKSELREMREQLLRKLNKNKETTGHHNHATSATPQHSKEVSHEKEQRTVDELPSCTGGSGTKRKKRTKKKRKKATKINNIPNDEDSSKKVEASKVTSNVATINSTTVPTSTCTRTSALMNIEKAGDSVIEATELRRDVVNDDGRDDIFLPKEISQQMSESDKQVEIFKMFVLDSSHIKLQASG